MIKFLFILILLASCGGNANLGTKTTSQINDALANSNSTLGASADQQTQNKSPSRCGVTQEEDITKCQLLEEQISVLEAKYKQSLIPNNNGCVIKQVSTSTDPRVSEKIMKTVCRTDATVETKLSATGVDQLAASNSEERIALKVEILDLQYLQEELGCNAQEVSPPGKRPMAAAAKAQESASIVGPTDELSTPPVDELAAAPIADEELPPEEAFK